MGTSSSYAGSGGTWNGARGLLEDALSGGEATVADVLAPAAVAIDWAADADGDGEELVGQGPIPLKGSGATPIRIRSRGGRGGGVGAAGGGGGGVAGRRGTAGRSGGGSGGGRSRQRAAQIGAGVAAAGHAVRSGDAAGLQRLGLDLETLAALSPTQQAQRIIDLLVGPSATIEDGEISAAASTMVIRLLEADTPLTAAESVALFATEYVYEILLTELGSELRDGSRDGASSLMTEDELHSLIEASVDGLEIEGESMAADALESAIDEVLEFTRQFLGKGQAA